MVDCGGYGGAEDDRAKSQARAERALRDSEHTQAMARRLYEEMPGAEQPPRDERGKLWGEVEHTEHYLFCEQMALEIIRCAQAYAK